MPDSDIKFRVSQEGAEKTAQDFQEIDGSLYDMQKAGSAATAALANFNETMRNNAPTSQAYLLAQQNRNAVLSSMIPIQNKEIEATKTSTRGLGTLAAQMIATTTGSSALTSQVSLMTTALISGAGLTAGLAVAVGLFEIFTTEISDANKETEGFSNKMKAAANSSRDFKDALAAINFEIMRVSEPSFLQKLVIYTELMFGSTSGIQDRIKRMKELAFEMSKLNMMGDEENRISAIRQLMVGKEKSDIMDIIKARQLNSTEIEHIIKGLDEEMKRHPIVSAGYKQIAGTINILNDILSTKEKKTKENKKATSEYAKALNEVYKELIKILTAPAPPRGDIRFRGLVKGVSVPEKPKIEFSAEEEEYFSRVNDMAMITAGVLRDEFTQAWEDVFGEANSLFESFAQRISQYFVDLALRYVALNLFSAITGVPLNVITGGGNSPVSGGGGTTEKPSYNIILDGEVVGTFIDNRVPYSVSKATRLSIL